jgi:hypothetical protein
MSPIGWYYAKEDKQHGPVGPAELKQLADRGQLGPDDLVWREGMDDWVPARVVRGLFDGEAPAEKPAQALAGKAQEASPPTAAQAAGQPVFQPAPEAVPLKASQEAFERSAAAFQRARERKARHLFDLFLDFLRPRFGGPFVAATARLFAGIGHYGLYAAMAALVGFQVCVGVKSRSLDATQSVLAVGAVVVLVVLQYAAARFGAGLERLGGAEGGRMSSAAFLDCFALLNIALGLCALVGLSILAVLTPWLTLLFFAVAGFICCEYAAIVALNPEAINLSITSDARPGEEAIALLTFFAQLLLRLVPVGYALGVVWGTIRLGHASFLVFHAGAAPANAASALKLPAMPDLGPDVPGAGAYLNLLQGLSGLAGGQKSSLSVLFDAGSPQAMALSAMLWLVLAAALPMLAYLGYLICHLLISLMGTLLVLPGKLDRVISERADKEGPAA